MRKKRVNKKSSVGKDLVPLNKILPREGKGCTLYNKDLFFKRVRVPETVDEKSYHQHTNKKSLYKFYSMFMYDLLEAMAFDFIMGDIIIINKEKSLKLFMNMQKAPPSLLNGTSKAPCKVRKIPHLDFSKLDYSFPKVMMEIGYKDRPAAFLKLPAHLYMLLLEEMYKGKRYIKSSNMNATPHDYYENVIAPRNGKT